MHFDLPSVNIPSLVSIKFQPLPLCLLLLFFVIMISVGSVPGQANHLSAHVHDKLLHFLAYQSGVNTNNLGARMIIITRCLIATLRKLYAGRD